MSKATANSAVSTSSADPTPTTAPVATLARVAEDIARSPLCDACQRPTESILGDGNPQARLVFVGGGDPRQSANSAAGQLLDKMIEAMGLARHQVYLMDAVDCPACDSLLQRQIQIIQPKIIVALGEISTRVLLQTHTPLSSLRGRFHAFGNIKLMASFHPEDLLQAPELKREAWSDLKLVAKELGIAIPAKRGN